MSDSGSTIVPLFRTFEELQADEDQIHQDSAREWDEANKAFDAAMAKTAAPAAANDLSEGCCRAITALKAMAKLNPNTALDCAKMIADLLDIDASQRAQQNQLNALTALINARKAALDKRDQRVFGFRAFSCLAESEGFPCGSICDSQ
jgi:hypothetical protein